MKTYVLDAGALVAHLLHEPSAPVVERILYGADWERPVLMSAVNWGEVYLAVWRGRGEQIAGMVQKAYQAFPLRVRSVQPEDALAAARLRARTRLPYADCFAVTLAQQAGATLVIKDSDFKVVQQEVDLLWLK